MFCVASYTKEKLKKKPRVPIYWQRKEETDSTIYFEGGIMILSQNIFLVWY